MATPIRFAVAEHVPFPRMYRRHHSVHVLNLPYRFRDLYTTLHGTVVGADRKGVYNLVDNIVRGAAKEDIEVHCVAPAGWPTPDIAQIAAKTWRGPDQLNDAAARYSSDAQRRTVDSHPLLIVLDCAELAFADPKRHTAWAHTALLGAARGLSILAIGEDLSDSPLLPYLSRGNLFHLRTPRADAATAASALLHNARVDELPFNASYSYGYAYNPTGDPLPFGVLTDRL